MTRLRKKLWRAYWLGLNAAKLGTTEMPPMHFRGEDGRWQDAAYRDGYEFGRGIEAALQHADENIPGFFDDEEPEDTGDYEHRPPKDKRC